MTGPPWNLGSIIWSGPGWSLLTKAFRFGPPGQTFHSAGINGRIFQIIRQQRRCCERIDLADQVPTKSVNVLRRRLRYLGGFRGTGAYWAPGSLRDAFCSCHLSHFESIDRLIQEARTTKDHYLGFVSAEAAAEFWDLCLQRAGQNHPGTIIIPQRPLPLERVQNRVS